MQTIVLNTRYASQSLSEVPMGYWIDKSIGNCGLSYLTLTDNNNTIILLPRTSLIMNKMEQKTKYENLFQVSAGVTTEEILDYYNYCRNNQLPAKILITYKSFALGKLDFLIRHTDFKIYVDESQYVLDFARSEPELVNAFHNKLEAVINRVTFFSAHPPKREYLPEYIQAMPAIKYIWEHQTKATPYTINTSQPYVVLNKILSDLLTNGSVKVGDLEFKKAIVFLNSINGIVKVIEELNSKESIAYITGDTVRNDSKLNDFAHKLENCEKLPTITIGTSTMISGMDLYDNETMTIVVSTSTQSYTLFDKELDVPQAIVRQRLDSNPNNDKFLFILDKSSMEERIKRLEETYELTVKKLNDVVSNLNYLKEGGKNYNIGYELYKGFYHLKDNQFEPNNALLMAKKYEFQELYKQYEQGYNVMATNKVKEIVIDTSLFKSKQYEEYAKEVKTAKTIAKKLEIISKIRNEDWVNYLNYGLKKGKVLTNVKEAKVFYESRNDFDAIRVKVIKTFEYGNFYSCEQIKTTLQAIYDEKGLTRTAKATDLYELLNVTAVSKRINGKLAKGFKVIGYK